MFASLATDYDGLFRCPRTGRELELQGDKVVARNASGSPDSQYRVIQDKPVLVDFRNSVLNEEETLARAGKSVIERPRHHGLAALVKRLLSPAKKSTRINVAKLIDLLAKNTKGDIRILVVGGGSIGQGMEPIYQHPSFKIYSFDIYDSSNVQFVADAHNIPLADGKFDAVIVQAVLEHVLQPAEVVAEVWRVLKPGGIVYAETPFMQQVHEGAFDFTRFTESGHRYLFRRFDLIDSGASGGPGLQFMWSMDYLFRGLFRSVRAGKVAKLLFFWTQYLDLVIPKEFAVDGASGVYFLGAKSMDAISFAAIISHYAGAQKH